MSILAEAHVPTGVQLSSSRAIESASGDQLQLRSIYRVAAVASMLAAVGYLAIGVLMGMDPVERMRGSAFYAQLLKTPAIALTWRPIFVVVGFLTIPVITALSRMARSADGRGEGILSWCTIMAYVGSVTQAIDWMREYQGIKQYLAIAATGSESSLRALEIVSAWWVDPEFLWRFGALGTWYLVVSVLAARAGRLPRGCATFGALTGACLVLALIFGITDTLIRIGGVQIAAMQIPAALGGAVIGPIFHIWLAAVLGRAAAAPRAN